MSTSLKQYLKSRLCVIFFPMAIAALMIGSKPSADTLVISLCILFGIGWGLWVDYTHRNDK